MKHNLPAPSLLYGFLALLAFAAGSAAIYGTLASVLVVSSVIFLLALFSDPSKVSACCLGGVFILGSVDPPRIAGITIVNVALAACFAILLLQNIGSGSRNPTLRLPIFSVSFLLVLLMTSPSPENLSSLSTPVLAGSVSYLLIRRNKYHYLLIALATAGAVHAAIGLFESLTHSSVIYTGWKDATAADVGGIRRAASLVGDPNYLALTLLCCAPGVAFLARLAGNIWQILILLTYAATLFLTFSRGVLLAAFVCLAFYIAKRYSLFRQPSKLVAAVGGIIACSLAFALTPAGQSLLSRFTSLDASTRSRSTLQSAAFDLFQDNWFTGVGIGNLPEYLAPLAHALVPLNASGVRAFLPQTDPLNTYLLVGAEGGVLALALLIGVTVTAILISNKRQPDVAAVIMGVAAAAITLDLVQLPIVWCVLVMALHYAKEADPSPLSSSPATDASGKECTLANAPQHRSDGRSGPVEVSTRRKSAISTSDRPNGQRAALMGDRLEPATVRTKITDRSFRKW